MRQDLSLLTMVVADEPALAGRCQLLEEPICLKSDGAAVQIE